MWLVLIFKPDWIFTGKLKDGDKKIKGKFEIPNLSEENDADEIDVSEMSSYILVTHIRYRLQGYFHPLNYHYSTLSVLPHLEFAQTQLHLKIEIP